MDNVLLTLLLCSYFWADSFKYECHMVFFCLTGTFGYYYYFKSSLLRVTFSVYALLGSNDSYYLETNFLSLLLTSIVALYPLGYRNYVKLYLIIYF